jgi:hypothetical protein
MAKWTGRLRQLVEHSDLDQISQSNAAEEDKSHEGWEYLERIRTKLNNLVEDYARGWVNQAQFEELYSHYQKEREAVARLIAFQPSSDAWRMAVTEGHSVSIRRRLAARVLGYAVFTHRDRKPLRLYGEFTSLDERWIGPLLDKIQKQVEQAFVTSSFETKSEDATHLCAVLGQYTTLLALFTAEPARVQIQLLEDLHCHFEQANARMLERAKYDSLVFPYAAAFE